MALKSRSASLAQLIQEGSGSQKPVIARAGVDSSKPQAAPGQQKSQVGAVLKTKAIEAGTDKLNEYFRGDQIPEGKDPSSANSQTITGPPDPNSEAGKALSDSFKSLNTPSAPSSVGGATEGAAELGTKAVTGAAASVGSEIGGEAATELAGAGSSLIGGFLA